MEIASRTLLLQLLRFLNLKCGDTPLSLSSWCGASVSVPVPVRSSRTAMYLQCFVLAVCLWGISEEALKMSRSQHPGDKLRLSASQRWDLGWSSAQDECGIYWSRGLRQRLGKNKNHGAGNPRISWFCWSGRFLKMFKLTGLALLTVTVWIVSKIKFHCKAKWDILCTLVQLLALVNSYLLYRPWLWSRPEHRGCQETWNSVSTSSLLPGPRPVLSLLSSTCVYLWPSNTLASPALLSQPFERGSFFKTGSLYCAEILSLWTFAAIMMGNIFSKQLVRLFVI